MDNIKQNSGTGNGEPDGLLGGVIFGGSPAAAPQRAPLPTHHHPDAPPLKLVARGLKPMERQLLEGLVKVSQRRTPRLELLDESRAREADVIMIDTRDAAAMGWAHSRTWLDRRAVIWIDGHDAGPGHTVLRRPVQWPVLPMVLARALESGPDAPAVPSAPVPLYASAADRATHHERSPRVLVVDDSIAVRNHLRSLLEPRGYIVSEADSVRVGLESVAHESFDCVLMDVLMPETDGYEGCHQIKARLRGANAVPVVMLTSRASPFDRIRGKMAGCDAYLTKPVDPMRLAEVLEQLVHRIPNRLTLAKA